QVPDLDRLLPAARGEAPAVRAEGDAHGQGGAVAEGEDVAAGRRVPELHGPVGTHGGEAQAVAADGHAEDRPGVPAQRVQFPAGSQPAEARSLPSGLNATPTRGPPRASSVCSTLPVARSQTLISPRAPKSIELAEATCLPPGLNATPMTQWLCPPKVSCSW